MGTKRKRHDRDQSQGFEPMGATLQRLRSEKEELEDDKPSAGSESRRSSTTSHTSRNADKDGWEHVEDRTARKKRKKLEKNYPTISHSHHARLQSFVKLSDLQNLVLYLLADGSAPQWVSVQHHQHIDKVVVLMVPGLDAELFNGSIDLDDSDGVAVAPNGVNGSVAASDGTSAPTAQDAAPSPKPQKMSIKPDDYYPSKLAHQKLSAPLKPLAELFTHIWPIKTPGDPRRMHSPMYGMLSSPIPRPKEDNKIKGPKPPAESRGWKNQSTPITDFIMTKTELSENGYALHPAHLNSEAERKIETARRHKNVQSPTDGWVDLLPSTTLPEGAAAPASIEAGSILQGRHPLIMDCEMVSTTVDRFALARISLIDWDGTVVFDSLVKPPDPVRDYLTPYSGITKEMLDGATLTLPNIQAKLASLVTPQTILLGHSLDSDFRALKISFPFVVDTTVLYPHPKGPPQKSSLKWLTQKYLGREIQGNVSKGHDSVEDARAVLDLVRQKCERGKAWGTGDASGEPLFRRLARDGKGGVKGHEGRKRDGEENWEAKPRKRGAMVDWVGNMHGFGSSAAVAVSCGSDEEVVKGVARAVNGVEKGEDERNEVEGSKEKVPEGGCDFVFGRLRELEFRRGWSPRIPGLTSTAVKPVDEETEVDPSAAAVGDQHPKEELAAESTLRDTLAQTIDHIEQVYNSCPPRTAVIIYSGSGNPNRMIELQKLHARFKEEYQIKKWDELDVKWTDTEEQELRKAVETARKGVGFIGVTPLKKD
ncbi:hypothetical protein B9Z65_4138 [Elsinoe australis]|uniref:Exonuclease domain-containing protein n=1 Tax=Elsinoe australis TaxID=40998 RepID=A0A2P7Z1Y6_9PEZI|nr:hypothetical protein B9Z65_4138 [Elsinoe australis]